MPRYFRDSLLVGADFDVDLQSGGGLAVSAVEDTSNRIARYSFAVAAGGVFVPGLETTGVQSAGAANSLKLQQARDANPGAALLLPPGTIVVRDPFWIDDTNTSLQTSIYGYGTMLKLDPAGLPTSDGALYDPAMLWWAWPNTLRTAQSGTVVSPQGNAARGPGARTKGLLKVYNVRFDASLVVAAGKNAGAVYPNACAVDVIDCSGDGLKAAISAYGYSDHCHLVRYSTVRPPTGAYGLIQEYPGDSWLLEDGNGRGAGYYGSRGRGFRVLGGVALQHKFFANQIGTVLEGHTECAPSDNATAPFVDIDHAFVYVQGGQANPPFVGNAGGVTSGIRINDTELGADGYSLLELSGVRFHNLPGGTDPPTDVQFYPHVLLDALNPDSLLRVRGCSTYHGGTLVSTMASMFVVGTAPAVQAAIDGAYGQLGQGFEVWQRSGTWVCTSLFRRPRMVTQKPRPTWTSLICSGDLPGTIALGAVREYAAQMVDEVGNNGLVSTAMNIAAQTSVATAAIHTAGTGYTKDDVLTVVGGTHTVTAKIAVNTVNATTGAILTFSVTKAGSYSVIPANPVTVTGSLGAGATGATFDLTWPGGGNALQFDNCAPGQLIVFSSDSAGTVLAAPTRYVRLSNMGKVRALYDTGAQIDGVPWKTA